ncbi:TPR end-of-group domain-containing protein [Hymenobacter lapidiphilus]|uniref:DUF2268 domain-containing protein n=1 Tax=Hymenobacter lapidiphilus TaxID=2608003 RepID=A0A7Y7U464_9BACT|nr:DUF2268 domain-containing putative Zn-dependent protease [Hymenobacter lapidiphilus]NVO29937.1 hypothetical protein [Hymenobacter lapidiphilus]
MKAILRFRSLLPTVALLLIGYAAKAQQAAVPMPLDSLRARARQLAVAKQYPQAAARYATLARAEPHRSAQASAFYNAACYYALAGDTNQALRQLGAAQKAGYTNADHTRQDSDLNSLRAMPQFQALLKRMEQATARQANPEQVRFVTTDIDNFWRAYDHAARDPARRQQILEREYFGKASVGLEDYFDLKIRQVNRLVQKLDTTPAYYQAIRSNTLQIAAMKPQVLAGFRKLKELYPPARFADVYFVIGGFNSGGTATPNGLLIGADMRARSPEVPLHELSLWDRNNSGPLAEIPSIVAHEQIHFLQKNTAGASLLSGAINEGMADFLAELTTGQQPNARLQPYGDAHEKALWAEFKREMAGSNWGNWIANSDQETPDKPADLGYYVGYRICQAYYDAIPDKKQAVYDMLNIGDFPAFLQKSRYEQKLANR